MNIRIDGKPADITLESEKTVGEVLAGIQDWLETSGLVISGLELDGASRGSAALDGAFTQPLEGISSINVITSTWGELMMEALAGLKGDLEFYGGLSPEEQEACRRRWNDSVQALFLQNNAPELHEAVRKTLEGNFPASGALALAGERIRELENPHGEAAAVRPLAEEVAARLADLPLDMQTGKDSRAAETISLFSTLTEKLFRLVFLFGRRGVKIESIEVSSMEGNGTGTVSLKSYIEEFSAALREFIAAWENSDTVLVGDLAEYELSPRLPVLAAALEGIPEEPRG